MALFGLGQCWQLTSTKTVVSVPRLVSEIPHAQRHRNAQLRALKCAVPSSDLASPQYAVILGVSPAKEMHWLWLVSGTP